MKAEYLKVEAHCNTCGSEWWWLKNKNASPGIDHNQSGTQVVNAAIQHVNWHDGHQVEVKTTRAFLRQPS